MNSKSLYISSLELSTGSLIVTMGIIELLKSNKHKVAFFRPIIDDINKKDHNISFLLDQYSLDLTYNDCFGFDTHQVEQFIANNQFDNFIELLIEQYKQLEQNYDFILVEGLNNDAFSKTVDFDINLKIAQNLQTPYINILNGKNKSIDDILDDIKIEKKTIKQAGIKHITTIVNRIDISIKEQLIESIQVLKSKIPIYVFEEIPQLNHPILYEIKSNLKCKQIAGKKDDLKRLVNDTKIASMQVDNFLKYIKEGDLIVVAADRSDIILAIISAMVSKNFPTVCGILLTGKIPLDKSVVKLIKGLEHFTIPILSIKDDTYSTIVKVMDVVPKITTKSDTKIALAISLFLSNIDIEYMKQSILSDVSSTILTPTMFEYSIFHKARSNKQTIVLPESDDERILRASDILLKRDIVDIVLLGDKKKIIKQSKISGLDISKATFIDPNNSPLLDKYVNIFYNLRKNKGITKDMAKQYIQCDLNYFGTMMVYCDDADAMVSGAMHTTVNTIKPALQIIKTKPDISIVSSLFFMCLDTKVLVYADCAINQDPNEEQLAQIAITTAKTAKSFGIEPRVAMLSYSTGQSGKGADVDKVQKSTQIVKERFPELLVEGPIQYDAAIDKTVAKKKLPNSKVAGNATVFIFPDLNTGNNTYKAVQRSSGAIAIGPILQGLNKPINDLSRGCLVSDIVNTVAITAIQAQEG